MHPHALRSINRQVIKMGWVRTRIDETPDWLWRYFIVTDFMLCLGLVAPVRTWDEPKLTGPGCTRSCLNRGPAVHRFFPTRKTTRTFCARRSSTF